MFRARPALVAALGALALILTSLASPSSAWAAYVKDVDLGNISVKTDTWNPEENIVRISAHFNFDGAGGVRGSVLNSSGQSRWSDRTQTGSQFTMNYRFSLYDQASIALFGGNVIKGVTHEYNVTLTGPEGDVVYSGLSTKIPLLSGLKGGEYVLTFDGKVPSPKDMIFEFSMSTFGGTPGDVPLPGALVLLGTAVAGAGVVARRRAARAKQAA
ncbi:hypothetical protein IHV25_05760 [Phaeovibrio sulfidiphilus]|uniref:PEP-CTERM protein-sorting domain-containing protein n=1 Tax=Phaeovibrio sulfidiphilus TaxID=1220600 RepID=A0A8J6YWX1_9PROT|nr:hypothetical protein [Phaeovibrio sulfidiphilus]MBE1237152.1 hypothetical protein [Phaeovibrio sulfidiphilus]